MPMLARYFEMLVYYDYYHALTCINIKEAGAN